MDYDNLIFLHIQKAADSTLHPVLERYFSKRARHTLQPVAHEAIEAANPRDLELHEWARRRFQVQLDQNKPDITERLARLDRANCLYRPWGSLAEILKRVIKSCLATWHGSRT